MPVLGQIDTNKLYSDIINESKSQLGNVPERTSSVSPNRLGEAPNAPTYAQYGVQSQTNLPSDLRKTFLASTVNLGNAVIETGRQIGIIPEDIATREQRKGAESAQRLIESTTPQFKREAEKKIITDEGDFGDFSGTTLLHRLTASAPDMIATIGPAAGATKLLEASKWAAKLGIGGGAAASATEGLIAGAENAHQARLDALNTPFETYRQNPLFNEEVGKLDPSIPLEQREEQARTLLANKVGDDVFLKTAASTGLIGAVTGGGAIGNLLNRTGGKITQSYIKAVGKDAAQEAFQELGQSAGEHLITQEAKKEFVDPNTDVTKGLLNAVAEGAVVGGVMGGGIGAAGNIGSASLPSLPQRTEQKKGEVTNPTTGEKIQDSGVKGAYSKFEDVFTQTQSSADPNYKSTYDATVTNLQNIINEETSNHNDPEKTADEIRLKEAQDMLGVIQQSHTSLLNTERKAEEAKKAGEKVVEQGQEEAKKEADSSTVTQETPPTQEVPPTPEVPEEEDTGPSPEELRGLMEDSGFIQEEAFTQETPTVPEVPTETQEPTATEVPTAPEGKVSPIIKNVIGNFKDDELLPQLNAMLANYKNRAFDKDGTVIDVNAKATADFLETKIKEVTPAAQPAQEAPVVPPVQEKVVKQSTPKAKQESVKNDVILAKQEEVRNIESSIQSKMDKLKAIAEVKKKDGEIDWDTMWEQGTPVRHLKEAAKEITDLQAKLADTATSLAKQDFDKYNTYIVKGGYSPTHPDKKLALEAQRLTYKELGRGIKSKSDEVNDITKRNDTEYLTVWNRIFNSLQELKDANSKQETTKANVSSSPQPEVRQEDRDETGRSTGVRKGRQETRKAKEFERGQRLVVDATQLFDRELPSILSNKLTKEQLANLDIEVVRDTRNLVEAIVAYPQANGQSGFVRTTFDKRSIKDLENVQTIPPKPEVPEDFVESASQEKEVSVEKSEDIILSDDSSTSPDPLIREETVQKNKAPKKVKVKKTKSKLEDSYEYDDFGEDESFTRNLDLINSVTQGIEVEDTPEVKLTAKAEVALAALQEDLDSLNREIEVAKENGDEEYLVELRDEKEKLSDKMDKARGIKSTKNKEVSIETKRSITEVDEDGQEELFALPASMTAPSEFKVDHKINSEVFDRIKKGIKQSKLSEGLTIEYIEDFSKHDWSTTPINPSQNLFFAHGVHKSIGSETFIYINGSRFGNTKDMVSTVFHELVGHFGVRKLFDKKDGTNEYDGFLESLLAGDLKADIFANAGAWSSYLTDWKRVNVTDYISTLKTDGKEAAEKLYQDRVDRLPPEQRITINKIVNGKIAKLNFPKSIALRYADEYVAEVAAAKLMDDSFVENEIGLGVPSDIRRTNARLKRSKLLERVYKKVIHFLKKIFGSTFDQLTKEDVVTAIAESYDQIFNEVNTTTKLTSTKPFNRVVSTQYQGEDKYPSRPKLTLVPKGQVSEESFSLPPQTNESGYTYTPFSFVTDERAFSNSFLSDLGNHSETVRGKYLDKFENLVRNNKVLSTFTTFGNMQNRDLYRSLQAIGKGHVAKVEAATTSFAAALKGLTPLQNKIVFDYFTTKNADPAELPVTPIQRAAIVKAKEAIRNTGKFLADAGIIPKESFEANEDAYLHIQYLKFIDQYRGSGKKPSIFSFAKQRKSRSELEALALGQIKDVAFLVPETYGVMARDLVLVEMFNSINKMSNINKLHWVLTGNTQVRYGRQRLSIDKAREQVEQNLFILNELDRADRRNYFQAGQIEEEQFRLQTIKLQEDLDKIEQKFIDEAYQHAVQTGQSTAISKENFLEQHYVKMPDKKQLGQLRNKYVRKEIANDLEVFTNNWNTAHKNNIEKFFAPGGTLERINRFWKLSMVGLNPASWVRNFFGNFALLDLSTSTNKGKLMSMLVEEIHGSMKNPSKWWKLSDQYGLFGTTLSAVELQDIYNQYGSELEAAQASYNSSSRSGWDNALVFTDERLVPLMKMIHGKTTTQTNKMFAWLEGSFKTVSFRDYVQTWEKEQGRSIDDLTDSEREVVYSKAANHANQSLFDYSQVPGWVSTLRRVPFGAPFLTFTYKAGPAAIRAMVRQPIKFAEYATLPFLLTTIAMAANDWDDDDIHRMKQALPDYYRLNSGTSFLPFKDSTGRPQILPLDYMIPWSQYATAARHVHDNFVEDHGESPITTSLQSVGTVFKEFGFLGGPTPTAISAMLNGKDSFSGRSIVTPGASGTQQLGEIMTFAGNMMVPSWLSSHGWFSKMYDAFGQPAIDRFGDVKFTPGQAVSNITGFGAIGVSEKSGTFNRRQHFIKQIQEVTMLRNKTAKDRNLDFEDKASKIKEANQRIKLIRLQMQEDLG